MARQRTRAHTGALGEGGQLHGGLSARSPSLAGRVRLDWGYSACRHTGYLAIGLRAYVFWLTIPFNQNR